MIEVFESVVSSPVALSMIFLSFLVIIGMYFLDQYNDALEIDKVARKCSCGAQKLYQRKRGDDWNGPKFWIYECPECRKREIYDPKFNNWRPYVDLKR